MEITFEGNGFLDLTNGNLLFQGVDIYFIPTIDHLFLGVHNLGEAGGFINCIIQFPEEGDWQSALVTRMERQYLGAYLVGLEAELLVKQLIQEAQPEPVFMSSNKINNILTRGILFGEVTMVNLNFDMYEFCVHHGSGHPQEVMAKLGIEYRHAIPQSMGDCWWFFGCENLPNILPKYLSMLKLPEGEKKHWGVTDEDLQKMPIRR